MNSKVDAAISMTNDRLVNEPGNIFYMDALDDLKSIKNELVNRSKISKDLKRKLVIGRICTREIFYDEEYCNLVFKMLEDIYVYDEL